jgi:hypothetical protein
MLSFDRINRRTHLYLGLFVMPWLLMYGVSSFIIIHRTWFDSPQEPPWESVFERRYQYAVSEQQDLRATAQEILKDNHLEGAFWVQKPKPDRLEIDRFGFFEAMRITYFINDQKLRAERQRQPAKQGIVRMHFRGGYLQPTVWDKLWGFMVDLACVTILVWVASGLFMWWRLVRMRFWGAVAVAGGLGSFLLLVWKL